MTKSAAPPRIVFSQEARSDIREALRWGRKRFGKHAVHRYGALLSQAFRDIAIDPEIPGSRVRPEYQKGVRTYHLVFSRGRAGTRFGGVKAPSHYVAYRREGVGTVMVLRVLHDSSDLDRHVE